MRFLVSFLLISLFLILIFFLRPKENSVIDLEVSTKVLKDGSINTEKFQELKKVVKENDTNSITVSDVSINLINKLGQEILDEVDECERKFDEVLSVPINEISNVDNESLIYILEDFDEMKVSSPKLGKLMNALSNIETESLSANKDMMDNLSLIRPCRPFEKISFINELTKRYKDNERDKFLRRKIKVSIRNYLNKELEFSVNLSSINMLSNIVMSLVDEKIFDESMKETCELLIEDLENDFDDLVDLAEDSLESERGDFDSSLIKKESILSQKYKKRLLTIIDKI